MSPISHFDQDAYHSEEDALAKAFLDEAERFYNRIMDTITNSCIRILGENESPYKLVELPSIQGSAYSVGRNIHEILDS